MGSARTETYRIDLKNAKLNNANLASANLKNAILFDTNLYGATLEGTEFDFADLRNTKGLAVDQLCKAETL